MSNIKTIAPAIAISNLLSLATMLAMCSAHAITPSKAHILSQNFNRTTTNWTCGKFRVSITSDLDSGTFTYRSQGLTLTNGVLDGSGDSTYYTFHNGNYAYRLTKYNDGAGHLEVIQSFPGGGQKVLVSEDCPQK